MKFDKLSKNISFATTENHWSDEHKKFAFFLPNKNFPGSKSFIFRKLIKFLYRWYKILSFTQIFKIL